MLLRYSILYKLEQAKDLCHSKSKNKYPLRNWTSSLPRRHEYVLPEEMSFEPLASGGGPFNVKSGIIECNPTGAEIPKE
jgi:hypothetical protein